MSKVSKPFPKQRVSESSMSYLRYKLEREVYKILKFEAKLARPLDKREQDVFIKQKLREMAEVLWSAVKDVGVSDEE